MGTMFALFQSCGTFHLLKELYHGLSQLDVLYTPSGSILSHHPHHFQHLIHIYLYLHLYGPYLSLKFHKHVFCKDWLQAIISYFTHIFNFLMCVCVGGEPEKYHMA